MHTQEYRAFLLALVERRERAGLSQRKLALRLGKPHTYVNKCECGERQLNLIELQQWFAALEQSLPEFIKQLEKDSAV